MYVTVEMDTDLDLLIHYCDCNKMSSWGAVETAAVHLEHEQRQNGDKPEEVGADRRSADASLPAVESVRRAQSAPVAAALLLQPAALLALPVAQRPQQPAAGVVGVRVGIALERVALKLEKKKKNKKRTETDNEDAHGTPFAFSFQSFHLCSP